MAQAKEDKKPKDGSKLIIPEPLGMVTNGHYLVEGGIPRTRRKVAIVGFAPSSMVDVRAYFGDPEFEIWGINQLYVVFPAMQKHATRWFQIHPRSEYNIALRDHDHHEWLAGGSPNPHKNTFPIYMQQKEPDIPMSIPYPKNEILKKFGRYFTNTISWQIALAIYEGFESIYIFGVDMATDAEYREQRPSCEFFIGWARALGIQVYIPEKSDLCKTAWLYPFEDDSPFRQKIDGRRVELRNRLNQCSNQEQASHDERLTLLGALENMNYIEQTWCGARKELGIFQDQVVIPDEEEDDVHIENSCNV